jgi:hypothetical protein
LTIVEFRQQEVIAQGIFPARKRKRRDSTAWSPLGCTAATNDAIVQTALT